MSESDRFLTDSSLVDACVRGDSEAWATLVGRFAAPVRFAIRRTLERHGFAADAATIEDLESAHFLGLVVSDFRRLRTFRGGSSLATWMKVSAANATTDFLRRQRPSVAVGPGHDFDLASPDPPPDEVLEAQETASQLRALWNDLSAADAQFVELYFIAELPFEEIAARLGVSVPALYTRKTRVQRRLSELAAARGWNELRGRPQGSFASDRRAHTV